MKPEVVVVDSIQTIGTESVESTIGSLTQVRECAAMLLKYAKENNVPFLIVGHITKEGSLAGPKVLEHIVDTVLSLRATRNICIAFSEPRKTALAAHPNSASSRCGTMVSVR
jgi:DNA repair protein RadA/Sms